MRVSDLLEKGFYFKCHVDDSSELYTYINQVLVDSEYVDERFLQAIQKREQDFPTGIKTAKMGIALPHVDADYIKANALLICTLDPAVEFRRMDDVKTKIDVWIAFILLIKDPHIHIDAISQLTSVWQSERILQSIYQASTKAEVMKIIREAGL
ncbi:MAG: PTS sugar transporter subunit IIA [Erysipelotrichaceae bacterium]|nr:PTS sugar transporter subunit IIA [Erysipelotrichaceae bacterium]